LVPISIRAKLYPEGTVLIDRIPDDGVLLEARPELLAPRIRCSVHELKPLTKAEDFPLIYSSTDSDEKERRSYQAPVGYSSELDRFEPEESEGKSAAIYEMVSTSEIAGPQQKI
jgi:hypothetical protein